MSSGVSLERKRKNDAYLQHVMKELRSVPGRILAAASIAGFKAAVNHTYMDSGQFAMNWQIGLGKKPVFSPEYPYRGGLLKRNSNLTDNGNTQKIVSAVMRTNNLPESKYSAITGSALYKEIVKSRVSHVSIYNPYWNTEKYGGETYTPGGRSGYPANAAVRPGNMVDKAVHQAAVRAAYREAKRKVKVK